MKRKQHVYTHLLEYVEIVWIELSVNEFPFYSLFVHKKKVFSVLLSNFWQEKVLLHPLWSLGSSALSLKLYEACQDVVPLLCSLAVMESTAAKRFTQGLWGSSSDPYLFSPGFHVRPEIPPRFAPVMLGLNRFRSEVNTNSLLVDASFLWSNSKANL